jgi:hypothetical protein
VIAGLAVAISIWACLPFSRTFITSPPIVGVYNAETGEPLGGVQLAISLGGGDSLCASPALRTITDSLGAFSFPATEKHEAVIVIAPFERFFEYAFCARVAGTMRFVFEGHSAVGGAWGTTPVTLTCIESRTPDTKPVECTRRS